MKDVYLALAVFLLLQVLVGLVRVFRGPTATDRMVAAQLFGTLGVGVLLLLAELTDGTALRDVALVFALLGALATVGFVSRAQSRGSRDSGREADDR